LQAQNASARLARRNSVAICGRSRSLLPSFSLSLSLSLSLGGFFHTPRSNNQIDGRTASILETRFFPRRMKVPCFRLRITAVSFLRVDISNDLSTRFLPWGVQVNLFKCRSIQKGSSTRASRRHSFPFLRPILSLSLSFSRSRARAHSSLSFIVRRQSSSPARARARNNDRDIRFSNLFINARDGAGEECLLCRAVAPTATATGYCRVETHDAPRAEGLIETSSEAARSARGRLIRSAVSIESSERSSKARATPLEFHSRPRAKETRRAGGRRGETAARLDEENDDPSDRDHPLRSTSITGRRTN